MTITELEVVVVGSAGGATEEVDGVVDLELEAMEEVDKVKDLELDATEEEEDLSGA